MPDMTLELAEARLRDLLAQLGLDAHYVRGEGDTLWWRKPSGDEVPVTDFVGGYGSLVLGHNHPDVVALAKELLGQHVPVHAQFSYHPYANDLASALNRVLWREFGTSEPYCAVFASTGAEAVEVALKHAELARGARVQELRAEIEQRLADAPAELAEEVRLRNAERFDTPPVFLTLEGSFHGKLAGSVQLTHNPAVRLPFAALAAPARFVSGGDVAKAVDDCRATVFDLQDGQIVERDLPVIAGFLVEPIQGEGGIHELPSAVAEEIRAAADSRGFPVIVDEIQSGVGRTGAFYASSHAGLLGDYIVLAKALGGGIAKSSVLLVRQSAYLPDFELLHSSTFAKDAFSCHIGIRVIELLETTRAYTQAASRGDRLASALRAVQAEFPPLVVDVRGRGLMLGMEFADQASAPGQVGEFARMGLFGYLLAGFLLNAHQVRVFPTASAPNTLRFEPSILITDEQIEQLTTGLRAACTALRDDNESLILQQTGLMRR